MPGPYADDDIDAAVAAGALTPESAAGFRAFVEARRGAPTPADDEQFRLVTGFNDIFVSIALALVLIALGWLGARSAALIGGGLVAAASWALAEFFTARRRMALPSILLLLSWVGGLLWAGFSLAPAGGADHSGAAIVAATGLAAAAASYAHWRRFHVPIAVAAATCSILGAAVLAAARLIPYFAQNGLTLVFAAGLAVFAFALWWDVADPARRTRRADVAFWLHLAAAPMIVHPAFAWIGLAGQPSFGGVMAIASDAPAAAELTAPALAVAIYLLLALVALVVDRRALMVSALAYLLYAMNVFLRATGALSVSLALSALIAGSALLLLSAYWRPARRVVLKSTPLNWRARLPAA
ncbi:MAG TPA: hypothetical protein VGH40_08510 [Roseiarcus sp.]|jgi:hypothetical protein